MSDSTLYKKTIDGVVVLSEFDVANLSNPPADKIYLYAEDNGSGTTIIKIKDSTGTVTQLSLSNNNGVNVENLKTVSSKSDFPAAANGVITITGGAWLLTKTIDLEGDRLVFTGDAVLLGTSSETSSLKSTGLASDYLITTSYDLPIQNLEITAAKAIYAEAVDNNRAIDWRAVNFVDCPEVGVVSGYTNFVMQDSAFINSAGFSFPDSVGTIAFETTLFSNPTGTMLTIPASAVITRRFRIIYSSFIVTSGNTGINVSSSATIPVEGYILDTVNFSGGGTYIAGVQHSDNKSLFINCRGVSNSGAIGHMTMINNAASTIISQTGTAYKAAGATTSQSITQKFSHSDNRLTYTGALTRSFRVTVSATISSTNGNVIGLYVAENGAVVGNSESYTTANAAGKAENCFCQTVVELSTNDYVEVYVENETAANNITVTYMSVIIEALN